MLFFFFSSRRRHTRLTCDWSSDVCSSDLQIFKFEGLERTAVNSAEAGDIVLVTGVDELAIGTTVAAIDAPEALPPILVRSEERRVGKECRSRWSSDD